VDFLVTTASGTAECAVVPSVMDELRERRFHPETVGLDRGYDTRDLVAKLRARDITPHVAQNTAGRRSAIDGRTTRHAGYAISQRIRMKVEEIFGWLKTVGGFRKTRYRGLEKVGFAGYLVGAAYNLLGCRRTSSPSSADGGRVGGGLSLPALWKWHRPPPCRPAISAH
jgi:IS5 family transposase